MRNIIFILVSWCIIYSFSPLPTQVLSAWTINLVDSSVDTEHMSVDIDSNGYLHISYSDTDNTDLKYAFYNGTSWQIDTVDSNYLGDTSIKLDTNGYAHISYGLGDLKYASYNGTGWDVVTVDTTDYVGMSTSLELDSNGYAHISSFNPYGLPTINYSQYNGTGWEITSGVDSGQVSGSTSLELDSDGYAHISYYDSSNYDLQYAKFNGTGWELSIVDSGNIGGYTSLQLDSNGYGHISYYESNTDDLRYAQFNGTGWEISTIDTAGDVGQYTSIALDSNGRPYISYIEIVDGGPPYNLKLAYFNGSGWEIQTLVEGIGDFGGYLRDTSLALFNDYVYITYAASDGSLATITNAPQGFVPEPSLNILALIILTLVFWSIVHRPRLVN